MCGYMIVQTSLLGGRQQTSESVVGRYGSDGTDGLRKRGVEVWQGAGLRKRGVGPCGVGSRQASESKSCRECEAGPCGGLRGNRHQKTWSWLKALEVGAEAQLGLAGVWRTGRQASESMVGPCRLGGRNTQGARSWGLQGSSEAEIPLFDYRRLAQASVYPRVSACNRLLRAAFTVYLRVPLSLETARTKTIPHKPEGFGG